MFDTVGAAPPSPDGHGDHRMKSTDEQATELVGKIIGLVAVRELIFRWGVEHVATDGSPSHVWSGEGQHLTRMIGEAVAELAVLRVRSQLERDV